MADIKSFIIQYLKVLHKLSKTIRQLKTFPKYVLENVLIALYIVKKTENLLKKKSKNNKTITCF